MGQKDYVEQNTTLIWRQHNMDRIIKVVPFQIASRLKKIHFSKQFLVIQEAESTIRWTR